MAWSLHSKPQAFLLLSSAQISPKQQHLLCQTVDIRQFSRNSQDLNTLGSQSGAPTSMSQEFFQVIIILCFWNCTFYCRFRLKGRSRHVTANKGPCQIIQQVRWTHSIKFFLEDLMSYANKRTINGMWRAGSKTVSRLNPGFEWYHTKTNIFLDDQTRPILIWRLEALMLAMTHQGIQIENIPMYPCWL